MTFVSVLAVFGSNGTENKSDKFQKLFYDGLITALGSYASDVDAIVATSSPITALKETEKYGTALIQKLSSGAPLRALFQPELQQFQAAFDEAVAEAVETAGSGVAVVIVVYAGEVLHSTGEWLLADSTFSGEQMQMWLDSEAASAWQPEIQKLSSAPTGTEPINIIICTPSAGAKTRWPMAGTPDGSTKLTMLSKSRRLPVRLHITASWRINGKLASSANNNATSYEALQALSGDLARLHWENKSKLLVEAEKQEYSLAQRSFRNAPPALYILPSGPGGVQTQACGLLVVQGVNILLGSAFTDKQPPQWWPLVRILDSLDTVILPDWSAASIQSYNFLTKHLLSSTSSTSGASWLGWLFAPATIEPGSESPLLLAPPSTNPDPSRIHALSTTSDHRTRLFYKIGVGELTLHWLGAAVGALLIWKPFGGNKKSPGPLTVFLPITQPPEGGSATTNNSPAALLTGMVRMLRKVPEICKTEVSEVKAPSTTTAAALTNITPKKVGVAASKAPAPSKPEAMRNGTVPSTKTQVNGIAKNTATAATKPAHTATKPLPTKSAASSLRPTTAKRTTTVPIYRPSTGTTKPSTTSTAASKSSSTTSGTALSRPATASAHKTAPTRPTPRAPTKPIAATKAAAPTKKPPISKTEAKLTEHAAKVAAKTAGSTAVSKPGHEIMYAPAGRPSNLPPRRKVGEKTVMEELNELPEEVIKSPSIVDSLAAEPMKEEAIGSHDESEGHVSYPDSLRADGERDEAAAKSPEMELTSNGVEQQKEEEHVHTEEPLKVANDIPETFEMTKSPEMEFAQQETEEVPSKSPEHEGHEALKSLDVALSKSPARMDLDMPFFGPEEKVVDSKSPLEVPQEELISKVPADVDYAMPPVHHIEVEMQQQQETSSEMDFGMKSPEDIHEEETAKSPFAEMQSAIPPGHPGDVEQSKSPEVEIPHEQQYSEDLISSKTQPQEEEIANSPTEMASSSPPGHPKEFGSLESPKKVLHEEESSKFPVEDEFSNPPGAFNHHMVIEKPKSPVEQFHEELSQEHLDDFHTSNSPVECHEVSSEEQTYEPQFCGELSKSPASTDFMLHEHQDESHLSKSPVEHDDISQKQQILQPQFSEDPSESPAAMALTMPLAHNNDSHIPRSPVEHPEISQTVHTPEQQVPEELSNLPAYMDSTMPPTQADDSHMPRSLAEQHVIPQTEQTSEQHIHEELPESPAGIHFSSPHESHELTQKEQTPEPEFQKERSKSPAGMDFALSSSHQGDFITSKSPSEQHESLLMAQSPEAESQLHVELPASPATNAEHQDNFHTSTSPTERYETEPFHEEPSESLDRMGLSPNQVHPEFAMSIPPQEELGESKSPFHQELSKSPSLGMEQHDEHHEELGLSNSPFDNTHPSSDLTNPSSQEPPNFEMPREDIPTDQFGSLKTSDNSLELSKSPAEVQVVVSPDVGVHKDLESVHSPVGGTEIAGHHQIDASAVSGSYDSDIDSRPPIDYHLHHGGDGMQFGDLGSSPGQQNPASTTAENEYPVHEVNLGVGRAIPEVSDHVDSTEATIHNEDPYQLHSSQCDAQLADSTTSEVEPNSAHAHPPEIGFMDLESLSKTQEENIHSPSSEISNDSVIHTGIGGKPFPPGFISEMVSSTSPQAHTGGSSTVSPTSGFTNEHPLLYKDQRAEELEHDLTVMTDAALTQKFSPSKPSPNGTNGITETNGSSEQSADGNVVGEATTVESNSAVFDPLMEWGQPQGMPAPIPTARGPTALTRMSRPGTSTSSRASTLGTKTSTNGPASMALKAPENLKPGPPILIDVVWVPGYIIRVPFAMATQFFTQVRARVYVLSGECLHPITGEALIAGVSKWTPEEREAVTKLGGGRGVESITVVPTDEPLEWVRWLRRSAGGGGNAGTGEERLQAAGLTVQTSATLCDIHFSDNSSEITCPGTQLLI